MKIKFYQLDNTVSKNTVHKNIPSTHVEIDGEFRDSVDISNPTIIIDISSTSNITAVAPTQTERDNLINIFRNYFFNSFNYVILETTGRGYFVKKITLLRKNIVSIDLHVDVLSSFQDIIYSQYAFVSRNKVLYNIELPDERRIVTNETEINFITLTNLSTPEINFNTAFGGVSADVSETVYNFVAVSWNQNIYTPQIAEDTGLTQPYTAGSGITNLPSVRNCSFAPHTANVYVLNRKEVGTLLSTISHNTGLANFVGSIFAYPIDFKTLYPSASDWNDLEKAFLIGDTDIWQGHNVHDNVEILDGYGRVADFEIPNNPQDFNDLEPYSIYELFIPYYGYYKLDYNALRGHRIYVFMALNYEVGTATYLLYDLTNKQLITSLQAQLGIAIPKTISNLEEVKNRHEANNTSLGFGILASILSVVGGIVTGGAIAGAKAIGTYAINEKSNIVSGSRLNFNGDTAPLFAPHVFYIKQTKRLINYSLNSDFLNENGGVCNELHKLVDLENSGYTEVADIPNINFGESPDNIPTDTEVDEIKLLLKSGVIL